MIIKSLEQLKKVSKKIADKTSEKDFIFLTGEIGVGKTTFTRYFINHLQEKEGTNKTEVLSPTFNLLYEYNIKKLKVMHYDLYRIKNIKEINQLGVFNDNIKAIKIIEWPELIKININNKLNLKLSYLDNENEREIKIKGNGKWKEFKINEL